VSTLDELSRQALAAIAAADDLAELDRVRVTFTGKRSELVGIQATMRDLEPADRKDLGQQLNAFRTAFQEAFDARRDALADAALTERLEGERLDLTLPPRRVPPGRPHLLTQVEEEMLSVFTGMGYRVAEGPEAEAGAYNFDLLNIEPDHPARQEMDTIYVDGFEDVVRGVMHVDDLDARDEAADVTTEIAEISLDYGATSLDTIRQMVAMNLGISLLPALYVRSEVQPNQMVTSRPLDGPQPFRAVGMVWRERAARGADYRELAQAIRQILRQTTPEVTVVD